MARNIGSAKCPLSGRTFRDPVIAADGHTYERENITQWLQENETSPLTNESMDISTLRPNHTVKRMVGEFTDTSYTLHGQHRFELNVDIKKSRPKPLFQGFGKCIYEVEWINIDGPPIVLLRIDGAKASREASFYVQLSCHPHIVRTFGLVDSNPDTAMLLQENAPDGDLFELLRDGQFRPSTAVFLEIFLQITDAMICLADNNIVHGDLACRNILVFRWNSSEPKENLVKLTDFGLTRASHIFSVVEIATASTMNIIPIRYAAPEILRDPDRLAYSEKSDIYSMGILMWEACSYGTQPYLLVRNENDIRRRKLNDERLPQPESCDDELWTIINECWSLEPQDRPDFRSLKESLLTLKYEWTNRSRRFNDSIISSRRSSVVSIGSERTEERTSRDDLDDHQENGYADPPRVSQQRQQSRQVFRSTSEVNISHIDNKNDSNSTNPRRSSIKSPGSKISRSDSPSVRFECHRCGEQLRVADYQNHQNNCIQNRSNRDRTQKLPGHQNNNTGHSAYEYVDKSSRSYDEEGRSTLHTLKNNRKLARRANCRSHIENTRGDDEQSSTNNEPNRSQESHPEQSFSKLTAMRFAQSQRRRQDPNSILPTYNRRARVPSTIQSSTSPTTSRRDLGSAHNSDAYQSTISLSTTRDSQESLSCSRSTSLYTEYFTNCSTNKSAYDRKSRRTHPTRPFVPDIYTLSTTANRSDRSKSAPPVRPRTNIPSKSNSRRADKIQLRPLSVSCTDDVEYDLAADIARSYERFPPIRRQ
ncbi:unnamed protein product [Adineta ricciae]|uniref:Uncharacterized protein n=1 Tax=Adineta ricciae TaxID=249248 RepID=A0A815QLC3_ADIRI|nr:unnamed protein product [Adineta ricciae]